MDRWNIGVLKLNSISAKNRICLGTIHHSFRFVFRILIAVNTYFHNQTQIFDGVVPSGWR